MLMLVHPRPAGQGTDPPRRGKGSRSTALRLTQEELRHLRAAIKNTARALGGMDVLASAAGLSMASLNMAAYGKSRGSVALARCVARAAGTTVEAVLGAVLNE